MKQIIDQYLLLTDWFVSVLDGINDKDGSKTIQGEGNSLEWIAGHLVTGRYRNLLRIGVDVTTYKHLEKFMDQSKPPPNAIAFEKDGTYPTLSASVNQWQMYSELFLNALETVDEDTLQEKLPFTLPGGANTLLDALSFIALHESYHIGQMSMIRKFLGYPAMKLGRRS